MNEYKNLDKERRELLYAVQNSLTDPREIKANIELTALLKERVGCSIDEDEIIFD